jgi:hypothetical protein
MLTILLIAVMVQPVATEEGVYRTALELAASADPSARAQLIRMLHTPKDLAVLAAPAEAVSRHGERPDALSQIFAALEGNRAPDALPALVALTRDRDFLALAERTPGSVLTDLLRATTAIADPPAPVVSFWRDHAKPDDGYVNVTTQVLAANGSAAALQLLEELLADSRFSVEDRVAWLWSGVMPQRLNAALIERLGRAAGRWPDQLKLVLLDILFDPAPHSNAPPGAAPLMAPPLTGASPASAGALRDFAAAPWLANAPPAWREKVRTGLAALPTR